jgi:hypothetical protein
MRILRRLWEIPCAAATAVGSPVEDFVIDIILNFDRVKTRSDVIRYFKGDRYRPIFKSITDCAESSFDSIMLYDLSIWNILIGEHHEERK